MRILVTGANGFLGEHAVAALFRAGKEVIAIGRRRPRAPVSFFEANPLEVDDIEPLVGRIGASHLLLLAWYTEHARYWDSRLNLRWADATARLVEAFARAGGQRVVVAGTCAEYDWSSGYCREENTPVNPASLYGAAKDLTRRAVSAICGEHGIGWAWGRVFFPYGRGEVPARLVPSVIAALRGECTPFPVHACAYRDFLHASDVAEAFVTLLTSDANGVFNISSGEPTRIAELVTTVASLLGADPKPLLERAAERPGEPPLLVGDNAKLRALGWRRRLRLAEGLRLTLEDGGLL